MKRLLTATLLSSVLAANLFDVQPIASSMCSYNRKFDEFDYCSLWQGLQPTSWTGQVYVSIVDVKTAVEGSHMVDMVVEANHPDVQLLTQVTNITSGKNLAQRYFYTAQCLQSQCTKV